MNAHNQKYLDELRHSASHLLAAAVLKHHPDAKPTIGPAIENGFYYDFEFSQPISETDLKQIQKSMKKLSNSWKGFERKEVSADEARDIFKDNPYKLELIEELETNGDVITLYTSGEFTDLCRGGHVDEPYKELKHFKLLSIAGAYWRGDEKNTMLTRIYGTAFPSKKELDDHLRMLEEAKKRDHKVLGKKLDLFTFSPLVGPGLPLWTPKGTLIRTILDDFVWSLRKKYGYQKVEIPHITKKDLFEVSGHWEKFSEELFKIETREGHLFAMKPMNCPFHTQIFDSSLRSYRDMPQRYANTTMVYRDEQSGELSGLSRVRCITQDDAHVFCRHSQIQVEAGNVWEIIQEFYKPFGFDMKIRLSMHDPENMDAYMGSQEAWETSTAALRSIIESKGEEYYEAPGEAAFYGPKIDFIGKDSLGREWQVATIQLDMNMPERFDLSCINEDGEEERVVMIHAAIMGSIERFMSVLIEHTAGNFPLWLAPVQVVMLPVSEKHNDLATKAAEICKEAGLRVELDDDNKTLPAKIRRWTLQKVPYMCIIGDKEAQKSDLHNDQPGADLFVSVRSRNGEDAGMMSLASLIDQLLNDIERKTT